MKIFETIMQSNDLVFNSIRNLAESGTVNRNWLERQTHEAGVDFDSKYDQSFGKAEQAIARENLEANEESNEV